VRICLTNVSFFQNDLGSRAVDLPIPPIQNSRVVLLGLRFDVFLDCSTINNPLLISEPFSRACWRKSSKDSFFGIADSR